VGEANQRQIGRADESTTVLPPPLPGAGLGCVDFHGLRGVPLQPWLQSTAGVGAGGAIGADMLKIGRGFRGLNRLRAISQGASSLGFGGRDAITRIGTNHGAWNLSKLPIALIRGGV